MMKSTVLKGIAVGNLVIVLVLNLLGCGGAIYTHGFWEGWALIMQWYSPFNIVNHLLNLVLLSPAILCWYLLRKMEIHTRRISRQRRR